MVSLIILALYTVIILVYLFRSFFIVYHLANFSIKSKIKTLTLFIFIVLSVSLFFTNAAFFFSVNWNALLGKVLL